MGADGLLRNRAVSGLADKLVMPWLDPPYPHNPRHSMTGNLAMGKRSMQKPMVVEK